MNIVSGAGTGVPPAGVGNAPVMQGLAPWLRQSQGGIGQVAQAGAPQQGAPMSGQMPPQAPQPQSTSSWYADQLATRKADTIANQLRQAEILRQKTASIEAQAAADEAARVAVETDPEYIFRRRSLDGDREASGD